MGNRSGTLVWNWLRVTVTANFNFFVIGKLKVLSATFLLFCFIMSKREPLWNKEKCFLFHFESSFRSWDDQVLTFQIFKFHDVIKCASMKHKTFYWITWEVNTSGNEIWPDYVILQKKIFYKKSSMKNVAWKLIPGSF